MKKSNEKKGQRKGNQSIELQEEVTRVRNHMWSKYGPNNIPPFDPKSMSANCDEAGAKNVFPALLSAMSSDDQSQNRELQNGEKCGIQYNATGKVPQHLQNIVPFSAPFMCT